MKASLNYFQRSFYCNVRRFRVECKSRSFYLEITVNVNQTTQFSYFSRFLVFTDDVLNGSAVRQGKMESGWLGMLNFINCAKFTRKWSTGAIIVVRVENNIHVLRLDFSVHIRFYVWRFTIISGCFWNFWITWIAMRRSILNIDADVWNNWGSGPDWKYWATIEI